MLELPALGTVLAKHFGVHEGLWELTFEFQVGIGAMGPSPDRALPGAMFQVCKAGLTRASKAGPLTFDAAVVNPLKQA